MKKSLFIFTLSFLFQSVSFAQLAGIQDRLKNPSPKHILVVSHRGDWTYAPENSLAAVQRCIDLGVDIVEIDVRLTKDGHLVAMHDNTVDRTTTGKGKVSDLSLAQIKSFRLRYNDGVPGSRQQVPTLSEVMELAKGKIMVNLDKTEGKTLKQAYDVLKRTGTIDHAIFKGNDQIEVMRGKYGSLLDSIIYMPKVWYSLKDIPAYIDSYNKSLNPIAYEMIFDSEESKVFKAIKNLNASKTTVLGIALWDELCAGYSDEKAMLDGPDTAWGWLVDNGVNAIMTNRPKELISYLSKRGLR